MSDLYNITAVILAGGLGTRLRGVVSDRPKVMAEINGRPFLYYLLDQLISFGIEQVVISTGFMADVIEGTTGCSYNGLQIFFSREATPLGTAGAAKLAGHAIETDQCLVINGDSYTEYDLGSLFMYHKHEEANITILVKSVEDTARFGSIQINDQNKIEKFIEKRPNKNSNLINVGIYIMKTSVLQKIPNKIPYSLEYDFFPSMICQGIYGFKINGKFIDIGTPKSYLKANTLLV